jgi:hypothetical protein
MKISSLSLFVLSLKENITKKNHSLEVQMDALNSLLEILPVIDLKIICLETLREIREVIQILGQNISQIKDQTGILQAKWISVALGGRIPPEIFLDKELKVLKFIKANQLEKKFLALGVQLSFDNEKGIAIPVEIEPYVYQEVYWSDLSEFILKSGYRFYFKGLLVFQTDENYRLIETYSPLLKGVAYYDPVNSPTVASVDRRDPSEWDYKNYLEIWVWSGKEKGYTILVKDEKGYIYSIGILKGKISTPDPRFFEESFFQNIEKYQIEITYRELKELIEQISKDKFYRQIKRSASHLIDCIDSKLNLGLNEKKWQIPFFKKGISIKKLQKKLKDVRESKRN